MRKFVLVLAAASLFGVGSLATAQAQTNCKSHKDQNSCAADKACKWVTKDNECNKAQKRK
jgi:hypothetical protein